MVCWPMCGPQGFAITDKKLNVDSGGNLWTQDPNGIRSIGNF